MKTVILVAFILIVVTLAILKIVKEKRKGVKCIGCPGGCQKCEVNCSEIK